MTISEGVRRGIEAEWEQALTDAQLNEKVTVWFTDESPPGSAPPGAQYFYPYQPLEGHGLSDAQLEEAESDACADLHRVIVHLDFVTAHSEFDDKASIAALGGLMRHELEHARQQEALGSDFLDLDGAIVDPILSVKAGGLFRSTVYYTLKPAEQDANAAAALYLRKHHPASFDVILEHPKLGQLARSNVGPEDPDTLLKRTVCFLYLYRDLCQQRAAKAGFSFDDLLGPYSEPAAEMWRTLEDDGSQPMAEERPR